MRLTQKERSALLAGETPTITRKVKPDIEPGDTLSIAHSKPRRYWDETTGSVFGAPRERSAWITVTAVTRHRKGGFVVRYDVTDNREQALMLARGGGYTTDPSIAIDTAEAHLSQKDRKRLSVEARARYAEQKERDEEEMRRQKKAFRARLEEALQGLSPLAQQALLADFERQLRELSADTSDRAA